HPRHVDGQRRLRPGVGARGNEEGPTDQPPHERDDVEPAPQQWPFAAVVGGLPLFALGDDRHGSETSRRSASSISRREMPSRNKIASRYGTLSAVSAARCTTGFALNAIPRPAAASMSMSLAPSPTAMV